MAHIIPLVFNHRHSHPKKSNTHRSSTIFSPSKALSEIHYARPCLSAWTARLVGDRIYCRVGKLTQKKRTDARKRRHLRATTNKRTKNNRGY
ncbi:hypothetical protein B0H14DRAFT_2395248 [Mycena olivaceomarginata]|nr:hypothetical protein B0H14DRAFT_2395248 [Mycena olivaceomarginata]